MKPGDVIEAAIWLNGEEQPHMIESFKKSVLTNTKNQLKDMYLEPGEFTWTIKRPGEDRVPEVPKEITGLDVRLLVGEAMVFPTKRHVILKQSGFVYDLTKEDLNRLRRLTRQAHAKIQPGAGLNDKQCDAIIEYLGPDVALKTLRNAN